MSRLLLMAHLLGVVLFAQATTGFHPRAYPADYATNTQSGDTTFAASIVPPDQVKHLFPVDISGAYVVVEFAAYPKSASVELDSTDAELRGSRPDPVRPADALNVTSMMKQRLAPRRPDGRTSDIYGSAEIGHVSGTDPYTGQRVHGTYTATGVGVENGPARPNDYPINPGLTADLFDSLERELQKQSLPTGQFTTPTAGYLYFPTSSLKKRSDGTYQLDYVSDAAKVQLNLPAKPKPEKP